MVNSHLREGVGKRIKKNNMKIKAPVISIKYSNYAFFYHQLRLVELCIIEILQRKGFYFNKPGICFNSLGVFVSLVIFLFNFNKESLRSFKYYFFYIKKYLELVVFINSFPILFTVNFFKFKSTNQGHLVGRNSIINELVAITLVYPSADFLVTRLVSLIKIAKTQQNNFDTFTKIFLNLFKKKKWGLIGLRLEVKGRLGGSDRSRKFHFIEGQTSIKTKSNFLNYSQQFGVNDSGVYSVKVYSYYNF